jgi:hypothetical protein
MPRRDVAKVTLSFAVDHIVRLDRLAIDVRARTGNILTRGEVLRALLDALFAVDFDIQSAYDETTLKDAVLIGLQQPPQSGSSIR